MKLQYQLSIMGLAAMFLLSVSSSQGQVWNIGAPTPSQDYGTTSLISGSGMGTVVGATAVFTFQQKVPFDLTGMWTIRGHEDVTAVNMAGMPRWSKDLDPAVVSERVLDKAWPVSQFDSTGVTRSRDYKARIEGTGSNAETTSHRVYP